MGVEELDSPKVAQEESAGRRRLVRLTLRDSAIILPATVVQGLGGIAVTAIISKLSRPEEYGDYTLAISLSTTLAMLAGQWMNESLIRLWPEQRTPVARSRLYGTLGLTTLAISAVLLATSGLVLIALQPRLEGSTFPFLAVAVLTFPLLVLFGAARSWSRAVGRTILFTGLSIWRIIGAVILGLVLVIWAQAGTIGFVWGVTLACGAVALWIVAAYGNTLWRVMRPAYFSPDLLKDAFRYSLPMVGISLSGLVLSISDRYLIAGFLNTYMVGIYALSYSIAQRGMELVIETFARALQPIIFRCWEEEGRRETQLLLEQISRYFALVLFPLAAGITVLAEEVVVLLSTVEYVDGARIIGLVCAGMICLGYAGLYESRLVLTKRTAPMLWMYLVATAVNLGINIAFIPRWGYTVAAWSTLVSYGLMWLMAALWRRRELPLHLIGPWIWRPMAAAVGMALTVAALRRAMPASLIALAVQILIGVLVYAGLALLFRAVRPSEVSGLLYLVRGWMGQISFKEN